MATLEHDLGTDLESDLPSRTKLLAWYRTMVTARHIDDREAKLYKQGKVFFLIAGAGHEAIQVALADLVRPGSDWFHLYYRDRALALALGVSPMEQLLQGMAAEADPASGGRQMPAHFGDSRYNIVSASSPTGTQFLHAVGTAEAGLRATAAPELRRHVTSFAEDEIVVCTAGDGTTSEGEFWEALNTACNLKLPVLFVIEDNGYAISVPVEVQTAGGNVSRLLTGFPDLRIVECDGTDLLDSHRAAHEAVHWCRNRRGPALLHAHTTRPYSHSGSDDESLYRTPAERAAQDRRDPLRKARRLLIEAGAATPAELDRMEADAGAAVAAAADQALEHPQPPADTATKWLYSETVDPTGSDFDTEDRPVFREDRALTMVDLLNRCLRSEMERDPRIVVFGQDVADASREDALREVKGKGGVFKVTHGLQGRFGSNRVYNAPLAEANIIGRAIGHGDAGAQAGRGDPVHRLYLARLHADPQRAGHHAVPLGREVGGARSWSGPPTAATSRAGSITPRRRPRSSRTPRDCGSCCPPARSTPPACCARRSAATTRSSSSSTSTCTARCTTRAPTPDPTT